LKDLTRGLFLNVVIECHYTNPTHYEITVKTALCAEDFRISAGQYFIEVETDVVNLKKFDNNKFSEICRI